MIKGHPMPELSEDIKNSIFRWYIKVTFLMAVVIVIPLSFAHAYYSEDLSLTLRYAVFIFLMTTIPITVLGTNFTFGLIFPRMVRFKQKSLDVIYKSERRSFTADWKDIESAVFFKDIMGVNGCRFTLKDGKRRYIGQVGKEIIGKLEEGLNNYRIPYETKTRKELQEQAAQRAKEP